MTQVERWQLGEQGPEAYERHLVPVLFAPWAVFLVAQAALQPGERILDAACGTGIVARVAAPQVGKTGHITGCDLNPGMLTMARALSSDSGAPMTWQEGNLEALPFANGAFDVTLCQQGLQFCPNRAVAASELRRVLRPGGRLLLNVSRDLPHTPYLRAVAQAVTQHVHAEAGRRMSAPCTLGDREELRALLHTAGFRGVRIQLHILPMRITSLEHFLSGQFAASPIANDVAALDATAREAFLAQIIAALQPYKDDAGYMIPYETHVAQAQA